jgi:RhoGAP domain
LSKFDNLSTDDLADLACSYLNMNGCEEEGLYRIPGSGKDVKHWQRRFDTEHDINLFDEPELYDINTIGSMFKAWLRDLPDEIFPKQVQIKIAEQCMGATKTPQLLRDELSKLPPFNYICSSPLHVT